MCNLACSSNVINLKFSSLLSARLWLIWCTQSISDVFMFNLLICSFCRISSKKIYRGNIVQMLLALSLAPIYLTVGSYRVTLRDIRGISLQPIYRHRLKLFAPFRVLRGAFVFFLAYRICNNALYRLL